MWRWLVDLLRGLCPVCRSGPIFETFWRMNRECPHCAISYERETGFFMMSVFVGEVLAGVLALPFLLASWLLDLGLAWMITLPVMAVFFLTPLIFRYSRIIWLYIDQMLDPRPLPTAEQPHPSPPIT